MQVLQTALRILTGRLSLFLLKVKGLPAVAYYVLIQQDVVALSIKSLSLAIEKP